MTCQGGESTCAVLDTAEGTCRQTFPLPEAACYPLARASVEDGAPAPGTAADDILSAPRGGLPPGPGGGGFGLLPPGRGGALPAPLAGPNGPGLHRPNGAALRAAWNGEKLALARYDPDAPTTGLVLRVYDGAGALLYEGVYDTSLNHAQSWYDASGAFQNVAAAARYPRRGPGPGPVLGGVTHTHKHPPAPKALGGVLCSRVQLSSLPASRAWPMRQVSSSGWSRGARRSATELSTVTSSGTRSGRSGSTSATSEVTYQ